MLLLASSKAQVVALNPRSTAIEITAAGMDEAKVRPDWRPRYTLAAVKSTVIAAPRRTPLTVSSTRLVELG